MRADLAVIAVWGKVAESSKHQNAFYGGLLQIRIVGG
jgi:hypothetical protein